MPRTSRTSRSSGRHTPTVAEPVSSSSRHRPPSPLSPTRQSRLQEKHELQGLNDRLASYIDRVRALESENSNLQQQISTIEEHKTTEVVTMRNAYHAELGQLRKALDETAKERAKFQIDANKFEKEARELRGRVKDREKAQEKASRDLAALQERVSALEAQLSRADDDLTELRPENARLKNQLADAKKNLEEETLSRIDLQNQLITSQEGLKFENSLLEQQLNETKMRKQIEISELDGKLHDQYEEKLQQSLAELRDTYEKQLAENRDEFSRVYDDKVKNLQKRLDQERVNNSGSVQELREMETRVSQLTSRNLELESTNDTLSKRCEDLLRAMEAADKAHRNEMAKKDAEVRNKDEQIEEMLKDYRDLMEIKVGLDMEIAAYRKLLEGEEARLGLSGTASPGGDASGASSAGGRRVSKATPGGGAAGRGVKRRRIVEEETTEMVSEHEGRGDVVIQPLDKDGSFVAVRNNSGSEINIGGWTLTNTSDGEDVSYKFHRTTTLQPGDVCSVYSSDTNETHEPPLTLVMKRGGWRIGDTNTTVLRNKAGEEEASRQSTKERSVVGSLRYGAGHLYSQEGEGAAGDPDKNCRLM